jgi:hypothetical protein
MNTTAIKEQLTHAMNWAASGTKLTYAAIGAGLVIFLILFKVFFKDVAGFIHCIGFSVGSSKGGPSGGPGQPAASRWSRIKLLLGALVPAGSGYAAYVFLPRFFPTVFQ